MGHQCPLQQGDQCPALRTRGGSIRHLLADQGAEESTEEDNDRRGAATTIAAPKVEEEASKAWAEKVVHPQEVVKASRNIGARHEC